MHAVRGALSLASGEVRQIIAIFKEHFSIWRFVISKTGLPNGCGKYRERQQGELPRLGAPGKLC
jgi:hypothetical protein